MKAQPFPLLRGFSLIELLVAMSVLAAISTMGYVAVTNTRSTSTNAKLESDVKSINRSIQIYAMSGGDTSTLTGTETVLNELKTRNDSGQTLGINGSTLDARVWYKPSSQSDKSRAIWNNTTKQFDVVYTGGDGVKEFTLNEDLAAAAPTESARSGETTQAEGWVWETATTTEVASTTGYTPVPGAALDPSLEALLSHSNLTGGAFITTGPVVTADKLYDGAGYRGELGVFSLEGMGNPPYDLTTAAGLKAFMAEAVRRVAEGGAKGGVAMDRDGHGQTVNFDPGTAVAFILIPNNTFAASNTYMQGTSVSTTDTRYPLTSLSFDTGDVSGFSQSQAVSLGTSNTGSSVFAIEDLSTNKDNDYEDIVWSSSGVTQPDWSTMREVDPATYYSNWDNPTTTTVEHTNLLNRTGDNLLNGTDPTLGTVFTNLGLMP
jgi:prepilin-type N-terminal cleavage/methylation domain-containing protein